VPAAAVIPAPVVYTKVVAVKTLVVYSRNWDCRVAQRPQIPPHRPWSVWGGKGSGLFNPCRDTFLPVLAHCGSKTSESILLDWWINWFRPSHGQGEERVRLWHPPLVISTLPPPEVSTAATMKKTECSEQPT